MRVFRVAPFMGRIEISTGVNVDASNGIELRVDQPGFGEDPGGSYVAASVPVTGALGRKVATGQVWRLDTLSLMRGNDGSFAVIEERHTDRKRSSKDCFVVLVGSVSTSEPVFGVRSSCGRAGLDVKVPYTTTILRRQRMRTPSHCPDCGTGLRSGLHPTIALPAVGVETDGVLTVANTGRAGDAAVVLRQDATLLTDGREVLTWDGSQLFYAAPVTPTPAGVLV